jgi:hypothetical protein
MARSLQAARWPSTQQCYGCPYSLTSGSPTRSNAMATKPAGEEATVMGGPKRLVRKIDGWQRQSRVAGAAYGVVKKYSDDQANLFVVGLGWYGFLAIYPLMLVAVTVLGFVGVSSLGSGVVKNAAPVSGGSRRHRVTAT